MSENKNEQSFNEDELKDIMDEIESLEDDYSESEDEDGEVLAAADDEDEDVIEDDDAEPGDEDSTHVASAEQDDVDEDVDEDDADDSDDVEQMFDGDDDDNEDDDIDTVAQPGEEAVNHKNNNVVELNKPEVHHPVSGSGVHLNAHGQMNLAMNFEFNGAQSKIVLENGVVKINLPGVNVVFDEKAGCQISADNGMTFQLPLAVKKAS